jgi:hypothetical protein
MRFEELSISPSYMGNMALVRHLSPGPLSISASYLGQEANAWVFMVNFGYILFNRQLFF